MSTVLIVDDNDADQFMAVDAIETFSSDINILQAYDGREALEILSDLESAPEILFLDINMPGMNGHEFLAEFSKREWAKPDVIMLTSSGLEADQAHAKSYACVKDYLLKPLNGEQLKTIFSA